MKHTTSTRFATAGILGFLFTLMFAVNAFAAVDAYIIFKNTKTEATFRCKLDDGGNCVIPNVPAGTYAVTLLASPEYLAAHGGGGTGGNGGSATGGAIEISSFSWGVSNSSSMSSGSGLGAGKVSMSDLSVMKVTDKSSPSLGRSAAPATTTAPTSGGFSHKSCPLILRKAGETPQDYYQITLSSVTISGSNENPTESLSAAKSSGGKSAGYDVKANVKI